MSICQRNHPNKQCPERPKIKSMKLKPKTLWAIKRKDSNEIYTSDSIYWSEEQTNRAISFCSEEIYEVVKIKISQI